MNKIQSGRFIENFDNKHKTNSEIKTEKNIPAVEHSCKGTDALACYNMGMIKASNTAKDVSFKGNSDSDEDLDDIIEWLFSVQEDIDSYESEQEEIPECDYKTSSNWMQTYNVLNESYPFIAVSNNDIKNLMKNFFSNSDKSVENLIASTDFTKYAASGIPLKYSRKEFLSELSQTMMTLPVEKQKDVNDKLGVNFHYDYETGKLTGFDGILTYSGLDINNPDDKKVYDIVYKFIKENSVETGNKELDKMLNSLIKGIPEFISIIGKQQHELHDYSVDVHILNVMQKALSNPEYQKLTNIDKTSLKWAVILHDIAKVEWENDHSHPKNSANMARNILVRYNFPLDIKQRIYELIKNHHWLAAYNTGSMSAEDIAVLFRRKGDINIARIMAEADLKGINNRGSFWTDYGDALSFEKQKPIDDALQRHKQSGQLLYTSKITNYNNIPITEYKGRTFKVIDLLNLTDEQISAIYTPGTKKDDLRFAVHVVNDQDAESAIDKLNTAESLGDTASDGVLSTSYISMNDNETICNYKFGLSFDVSPVNTVNAYSSNQYSGTFKNDDDLMNLVEADHEILKQYRQIIPDTIKEELNLNDDEYALLYNMLFANRSLSRIYSGTKGKELCNKGYNINGRIISGKDIAAAIKKAGNKLIEETFDFNEVNLYKPIANGLIAKVDSLEQIPDCFLNYAHEHYLPIILLGSKSIQDSSAYSSILQSLL